MSAKLRLPQPASQGRPTMRHELTDEQWEAIEDIFPEPAPNGSTGGHECNDLAE